MRGGYIELRGRAEHEIRYRYQCERCDAFTEWKHSTIAQESISVRGTGVSMRVAKRSANDLSKAESIVLATPDEQIKIDAEAKERLEKCVSGLKKSLETESYGVVFPDEPFIADMYNEAFSLGKACPKCGYRQTWYPAVSDTESAMDKAKHSAKGFGFLGALAATAAMLFLVDNALTGILYAALTALASAVSAGLFAYVRTYLRVSNVKVYYLLSKSNRKPEVDWGGL